MSTPVVPPRPNQAHAEPPSIKQETPYVPPRPVRKTDPSPDREQYTRSPLNALPGFRPPPRPLADGQAAGGGLRRPPSINFPSDAGQEGYEYSSYDVLPTEAHGVKGAPETREVTADVPLHAPQASVPASMAKRNIAMVTRTDSSASQSGVAAKLRSEEELLKHQPETSSPLARVTSRDENGLRRVPSVEPHPLRSRASFSRSHQSLPGTSRPPSVHGDYMGIPEIGRQIPLYPNAGDVQAPSPGPGQTQHAPGIGFFNDGSARAHHRKRSSRHEFGPPDSYGLHGHGMVSQDQFEKDWIAKHPNEAAKESSSSNNPRSERALTSEQLNRMVHANLDVGMGTNREMVGTPTQEIAFDATDKYTQRLASPRPPAIALSATRHVSEEGNTTGQSPLGKSSFTADEIARPPSSTHDYSVIHVDETSRPVGKVQPEQHEPLERGRTPILADDEVLKRPGSAYMLPAVSADTHYDEYDSDYHHGSHSRRSSVQPPSRPSSRPGSVHGYQSGNLGSHHGNHLHRYISHEEHHSGTGTPLAEIEEYEPLFPDDNKAKPKALLKKRPSLTHHFPSQDIWEDTPSSLQYSAEVDEPELERVVVENNSQAQGNPAKVFETPEQEQRRKSQNDADMLSDQKTFVKPHFKAGVRGEIHRPGVNRFPSRDIWEDTPDSMRLETTVDSLQTEDVLSPPEERPTTAALPFRQDDPFARSTTGTAGLHPAVPERPQRHSKLAQEITNDDPLLEQAADSGAVDKSNPPAVPDRPKPSIPARPGREAQPGHAREEQNATHEDSATDGQSALAAPKPKPAVPARVGGKIAALKAGFMNDLNNRLQLGPQAPPAKAKEPESDDADEEKAPLQDARKMRARGPPRRKPNSASEPSGFSFSFCSPMTLWQIDESDEISVAAASASTRQSEATQSTDAEASSKLPLAAVGAEGDLPDSSLSASTLDRHQAIQSEFEQSLAQGGESINTTKPAGNDADATASGHSTTQPEAVRTIETAESEHVA